MRYQTFEIVILKIFGGLGWVGGGVEGATSDLDLKIEKYIYESTISTIKPILLSTILSVPRTPLWT